MRLSAPHCAALYCLLVGAFGSPAVGTPRIRKSRPSFSGVNRQPPGGPQHIARPHPALRQTQMLPANVARSFVSSPQGVGGL